MPCRILLVLWGDSFLPKADSYKSVARRVLAMNREARKSGTNITLEAYSVLELQSDLTQHDDVGHYEVVRDPASVPELRTIAAHQFAYLRDTDAQARLRDFRPGQIVRITRRDFLLGGISIDYRHVVAYDLLLATRETGDAAAEEDQEKE